MSLFSSVKKAITRTFNPTVFDSSNNRTEPSNDRQIPADPRTSWSMFLPRRLSPQAVTNILRSGALGDLWQFNALVELMLDTWPMLKKCQHELRTAVSTAKYTVHPYCANGKKPTKSAQAKADLVQRAMESMVPDPATDEKGFKGMLYDMSDAYLKGIAVVELQWQNDGESVLPRAATFVHPVHIRFDNQGKIMLAGANGDQVIPFDPDFFISSQYQSQSGSVLMYGMARPVGSWWCYLLHACEWMVVQAQKHGSPYTVVMYDKSLQGNTVELDKIKASLESSANDRHLMVPAGTTAELKPPTSLGEDNPQRYIKEEADRECQMLFLGQSSSTESTPGKLGNDDSKMEVLQSHKEAVTSWIASLLTEQFVRAVLRQNYGNEDECPTILADFAVVESKKEAADRWNVIGTVAKNIGAPLTMSEFYEELDLTMPKEGDIVLLNGKIGTLGETENPIQPNPTLDEQIEEQAAIYEATGGTEVQARRGIEREVVRASDTPKSSTQLTLTPEQAAPILAFLPLIDPNDVYHEYENGKDEYGLETEPHVTTLFGLTSHADEKARKIVSKFGPVVITLGAIAAFHNAKYDVLKVNVSGDDLKRLNKALSALPHEGSFKGYLPHLTLGYLKPGTAAKYTGDNRFDGVELAFDSVTFSPPSEIRKVKGRTEMPLSSHPLAAIPDQNGRDAKPIYSEYQELYREEHREEPRDWPQRWMENGGSFYPGVSDYEEGRMIALASSGIWSAISRFEDPAPPFDFNSGMGVRRITVRDAEKLGLMEVASV